MIAVLARLGVLLAVFMLLGPPAAHAASQPKVHKRPAGPCLVVITASGDAYQCGRRINVSGERMRGPFHDCLVAFGITTAGVAVGGIIGGAAARSILGGIVGGGGAACLSRL